ncbi:unnamed protein product [Arabidopsis thaliana]|uniref:acid phosphatase n=1 Tax=Arabidopsis thaliana TaxID=3702 RepID=A0A7G2EVM3_ARATH|nr:unnamed protein product [Arabidopsis thaliana]
MTGSSTRQFNFMTPPKVGPDVPYTFGVIGLWNQAPSISLGFGLQGTTSCITGRLNPSSRTRTATTFLTEPHRVHLHFGTQSNKPRLASSYSPLTQLMNSWLLDELEKVNRSETSWLIVLVHVPWYNNNNYYYMEGESMRVKFEPWFIKNKVDMIFAGHVHAYERSERVSNIQYNITDGMSTPMKDQNALVTSSLEMEAT